MMRRVLNHSILLIDCGAHEIIELKAEIATLKAQMRDMG